MSGALEDVSVVWLVVLTVALTVVSYLLLSGIEGVSDWVVWGSLMLVVAAAAAALVVFRDVDPEG